jgi:serine/threonine protein kinase
MKKKLKCFYVMFYFQYMHDRDGPSSQMLHRNVQPDNVMVTDTCVLKLCAFGSAR